MILIEEMKTSLFRPHMYYTLNGIKFGKIIRFSFISTLTGIITSILYTLFGGLLAGQFVQIMKEYLKFNLPLALGTILYMWLGILVSGLFLALIFLVIGKFNKYENMSYYKLYNYAIHATFPCIVLTPMFGPWVMLLAIGFFLMAVKGESIGAGAGFDPMKMLKK